MENCDFSANSHLAAKQMAMRCQHGVEVVGPRHPCAQALIVLPLTLDGVGVVEAEPSRPQGARRAGVNGDDFEIDGLTQPEPMVVGAHLGMRRAERDVDAKACTDVLDAVGERRRDDRDVVKDQHVVQRQRCGRSP